MNVRIFWVRAMKCMCAQTRPRFILSSERVFGGMEFEPMLTPREKSPLPENVPRGGSNPRHCGQRAHALPTELFRPPSMLVICDSFILVIWLIYIGYLWLIHIGYLWLVYIGYLWLIHIGYLWLVYIGYLWLIHIGYLWLVYIGYLWLIHIGYLWLIYIGYLWLVYIGYLWLIYIGYLWLIHAVKVPGSHQSCKMWYWRVQIKKKSVSEQPIAQLCLFVWLRVFFGGGGVEGGL